MYNHLIYKHLESDKMRITDAKDKVKYCVSAVDALGVEMTDARYH